MAVNTNLLGGMRMVQLANACKQFVAFHHVSTCGVQFTIPPPPLAKEEIPPCFINENLNDWVDKIMKMEKNALK